MKITSHTRQKTHGRCAKKYFLRYLGGGLDPSHAQRKSLFSIRELGGWVVHGSMARMVKTLASGDWVDVPKTVDQACRQWLEVVNQSFALSRGQFLGQTQLAESFNGIPRESCEEELNYWREVIPLMIENGFRVSATLGIQRQNDRFQIDVEQQRTWKKSSSTTHMVLDVLLRTPFREVVIDWKCRSIQPSDLEQVTLYMRFLHSQGTPVSKLSGFAVDLLREEIVPVNFNPYRISEREHRRRPLKPQGIDGSVPAYPGKPDPVTCRGCGFASLCSDAALP